MKKKLTMTIIVLSLVLTMVSVNALGAGCTVDNFYYSPKILPETVAV